MNDSATTVLDSLVRGTRQLEWMEQSENITASMKQALARRVLVLLGHQERLWRTESINSDATGQNAVSVERLIKAKELVVNEDFHQAHRLLWDLLSQHAEESSICFMGMTRQVREPFPSTDAPSRVEQTEVSSAKAVELLPGGG